MRDSMDIKKSVHIIPLLHHGYLKKQAALKNDSVPWCRKKKLYVYITTIKIVVGNYIINMILNLHTIWILKVGF